MVFVLKSGPFSSDLRPTMHQIICPTLLKPVRLDVPYISLYNYLNVYTLYNEPLTSLVCYLNAVFHVLRRHVPQDAGAPLLSLL
jgi:hypothetical protein